MRRLFENKNLWIREEGNKTPMNTLPCKTWTRFKSNKKMLNLGKIVLLKPKIAKQLEAKSRKREWREINPEFCSWFSFQGIMLWFDILGYWNLWKPSWAVFHPHLRGSKALLPLRFHECRNMKTGGGSSNMVMRPFPTSSLQSSFWYKHLLEYSRQKKNQPMLFKTTSFSTRKKNVF